MMNFLGGRNVHRRGKRIVGGLTEIDMIVRVDRILRAYDTAQHINRPIGDDFIGIHVRLGTRTRQIRAALFLDVSTRNPGMDSFSYFRQTIDESFSYIQRRASSSELGNLGLERPRWS